MRQGTGRRTDGPAEFSGFSGTGPILDLRATLGAGAPGVAQGMRKRPPILLDWFNVTYRSAGMALLLLVGLGAAGGYLWMQYRERPRQQAEASIRRADGLLRQAEQHRDNDRVAEICDNARAALGEARREFDAADYETARIAAIRCENLSQQAIGVARGEKESFGGVRFYRIEGDVRVKRAGQFAWESASSKMTLHEGDQIKTSSSASAKLIYFNGTINTMGPGSLLEVRELSEDPVTKVRRVTEKLNWGELMASTQKRNVEGSYHEIRTENSAARAEDAGEFRVRYDKKDKTTVVDAFDGQVVVASGSRRENVVAGERIRASATNGLTAKEILPGTPRLIAPSDQRVFVGEDPDRLEINLSWEGVAGADHYRLQISDQPLFTELLYDADRKDSGARIQGVATGDYFWRVAAVSRAGSTGSFSELRRFRVSSEVIRDRQDTTAPALDIAELVRVGPMVIINGTTEPGATLWIDSEKVDVAEDGSFYSVVRLRKEGLNELQLVAQDNAGNQTRLTREAYFEAY